MLGPVRHALWWLLGAVGVLLLIACANVSGLMLTRAAVRRREHAIRLALGATRGALGRLWAAESLLIAAAGGLIGLISSHWIATAIVSPRARRYPAARRGVDRSHRRRVQEEAKLDLDGPRGGAGASDAPDRRRTF